MQNNTETLFDTEEFLREWATVQYERNNTPEAIEAFENDCDFTNEGYVEVQDGTGQLDCESDCRCEYCNPRANY